MDNKIPSVSEHRSIKVASILRTVFRSIAVSLSFWTYRHLGGTGFMLPMILFCVLWAGIFRALHHKLIEQPRRKSLTSEQH